MNSAPIDCLNPCFSGNRFGSMDGDWMSLRGTVLILVLVEIGLGAHIDGTFELREGVLILVLVEIGLGE